MNKKLIFSVAAAAALLVSNPAANKADAAENVQVQSKVYYYQTGNLSQEQINSMLQKYLKGYNFNWQNVQTNKQEAQKPAEQPKAPVQQPAKVQEPAKAPAQQPAAQQPAKAEQPKAAAPATSEVSAFEQKVFELTNQERVKAGIPALKLDVELSKVAREKSLDMQAKGYFDHNSPTYGSPFDMMKQFGISYRTAAENIAMGQRSPEEVVNAWMNSEGHRKNILNANYTHLGVGYAAGGNYWTQMFIGK